MQRADKNFILKNCSISIGTVCLNDIEGLKKTIDSIQRLKEQPDSKIQLIIADGGSQDGSAEFALRNETVDLFLKGPDRGIYHGMNKILDQADGDFIIFMNAGDYFSPSFHLDALYPFYEKYDMVIGYSCQIYKSDVYIRPRPQQHGPALTNPAHQSVFISKKFYKQYNYDEKYKISADLIWLKNIAKKARVIGMSEIVSVFQLGGPSNVSGIKYELQKHIHLKKIKQLISSLFKIAIRYLFGQKLFYRIIYFFKYKRIKTIDAKLFKLL